MMISSVTKIISFIICIACTVQSVPIIAHQQENTLHDRLYEIMPVFNAEPCSVFMVPYGSSENEVKETAAELGLLFVKKEKLDAIPGAYLLAYVDRENIVNTKYGNVTSNILYIFTFHPKVGYFSYTIRLTFTDSYYALQAMDTLYTMLNNNIGIENFNDANFAVARCKNPNGYAYNHVRSFSCTPDKPNAAFTFTIIDITIAEPILGINQAQPNKQQKRKK